MDVSDRIKKAHVAIMRHPEFCLFAGLLACGKVEVTTDVPTAATDGWDVRYNPTFITPLSDPELRFLVLHEASHKAYKHLWMWRKLFEECAPLAGIAADYFVNTALHNADGGKGFIKFIEGGVPPEPRYKGWSVQQIYDDLKQQAQGGGSGQGAEGTSGPNGEQSLDQHDPGTNKSDPGQPTEEQKSNEIARALRHGEVVRKNLQRGMGNGNQDGQFGDLLRPQVDWRAALREFVQEMCAGRDDASWRRPSRRMLAEDIYMPTLISEHMEELVIGMDTSGSCFGTATMTRFVTELTTIIEQVKPSKVHVIYWDSQVAGHQTFTDGQFAIADMKPRGGGGTDGSVLFNYLRDKRINPSAVVQFTDGYVGSWGQSDWPTLWAITTNHKAPYGTSLRIAD